MKKKILRNHVRWHVEYLHRGKRNTRKAKIIAKHSIFVSESFVMMRWKVSTVRALFH